MRVVSLVGDYFVIYIGCLWMCYVLRIMVFVLLLILKICIFFEFLLVISVLLLVLILLEWVLLLKWLIVLRSLCFCIEKMFIWGFEVIVKRLLIFVVVIMELDRMVFVWVGKLMCEMGYVVVEVCNFWFLKDF